MAPLDGSIVAIAVPSIASSMQIGLEMVVWIQLTYLLLLTVLLINVGRLADLKGRKRAYTLGFVIFTAGSFLCGVSTTGPQLVAFRALQGTGASFMAATAPAIVTASFPSKERGKALGINAMAVYAGLMTGPVIGGVLVQYLGWRSIFFVNVPIGMLVVTLASLKLKETRVSTSEGFDLAGAATLSASLASFVAALTFGPGYGWNSTFTLSAFSVSAIAFALFLQAENKWARHPTFDLSLFTKNRLFAAANTAALFNYIAAAGVTFMISVYLQDVQGLQPETTGLFMMSMSIGMAVLAPVSGWLSDRFGSRLLSTAGMLVVSFGLLLLSRLNATSSAQDVISRLALVGIGFGLFAAPNTSAIMGSVKREKLGVAAGTVSTMRSLGQSIGLALVGAVIATALPPESMLQLFAGLSGLDSVARDEFVLGMRHLFLIASSIALIGTVASSVRGRETTSRQERVM
jgi:EmrB/QacA subfamily drug resistance transporter